MTLVSFFTNSFNRLPLLKNLLRSFELCNQYPAVEWVITDYGSTDGSREFLQTYAERALYPVKLILSDEQAYFAALPMPSLDRRTRFEAILRKYRNDARAAAAGQYLFDVATDHQFIRPGRWVEEIIEVFNHRELASGHDDLSGVIPFGYFRWRLNKGNNERDPQAGSRVPYFIAREKAYVDYSVMKRATAEKVGPYLELTTFTPRQVEQWTAGDDAVRPESDYDQRCQRLHLRRAFLKYPILVSFKNRELAEVMSEGRQDDLIIPLWSLSEMESSFGHLPRPVSSEELTRAGHPSVFKRSLAYLHQWVR